MTLPTRSPLQTALGSIPLFVWFVPTVMLLAATLRLPYGYYQLLRMVVVLFAGFIVWCLWKTSPKLLLWALPFGALILVFNPVFPIQATRPTWFIANVTAVGAFTTGGLIGLWFRRSRSV